MAIQIEGASSAGDGGVKRALVTNGGRLSVLAAAQDASLVAALNENAYNINTGVITGLSTADSAILYYKHLEDSPIVIDTVVVGLTDADTNNPHVLKIIKNPSAGTIVTGASAGDLIVNRNFNSVDNLSSSIFYKGANGNTFTDGTDYIIAYAGENGRTTLPIATVLKKGNSIGLTITPSLASGTIDGYVELITHSAEL